jgi:hypothetical protein
MREGSVRAALRRLEHLLRDPDLDAQRAVVVYGRLRLALLARLLYPLCEVTRGSAFKEGVQAEVHRMQCEAGDGFVWVAVPERVVDAGIIYRQHLNRR